MNEKDNTIILLIQSYREEVSIMKDTISDLVRDVLRLDGQLKESNAQIDKLLKLVKEQDE